HDGSHRVDGWWSLAQQWRRPEGARTEHQSYPGQYLGEDSRELVSACVLASVNVLAGRVPVMISMRGSPAVLAADQAEREQYHLEEAAFWGNIFVPALSPPGSTANYHFNVCTGAAFLPSKEHSLPPRPPGRVCSDGQCFPMNFWGPCSYISRGGSPYGYGTRAECSGGAEETGDYFRECNVIVSIDPVEIGRTKV